MWPISRPEIAVNSYMNSYVCWLAGREHLIRIPLCCRICPPSSVWLWVWHFSLSLCCVSWQQLQNGFLAETTPWFKPADMAGTDSKQFEAVMKALQAHDWHVFPAFRPAVYYHTRPFSPAKVFLEQTNLHLPHMPHMPHTTQVHGCSRLQELDRCNILLPRGQTRCRSANAPRWVTNSWTSSVAICTYPLPVQHSTTIILNINEYHVSISLYSAFVCKCDR